MTWVSIGTPSLFGGVFYPCFFVSYFLAAVFGNLISSTVLSSSPPENYTEPSDEIIADMCGIQDCPWNTMNNTNLDKPPDNIVSVAAWLKKLVDYISDKLKIKDVVLYVCDNLL